MTTRLILLFFITLLFCKCQSEGSQDAKDDSTEARKANSLGLTLLDKNEYAKARVQFIKASQCKNISLSDKTTYLENAATAFLNSAFKDSAKYFYLRAASINPVNSYSYFIDIANISLINKEIDSALFLLNKAYRVDSTKPIVNNLLGLIYLGEYEKSYYDPQKALKYNWKAYNILNDVVSKFVLAKNEYYVNNPEMSLKMFRDLHKKVPENIQYLVSMILIEGELGQSAETDRDLAELKKIDIETYNRIKNQIKPGEHGVEWNH